MTEAEARERIRELGKIVLAERREHDVRNAELSIVCSLRAPGAGAAEGVIYKIAGREVTPAEAARRMLAASK
ncbi:hypothetical protein ACSFA7_22555 [Variovorax sp. LT1R20]|uniref:hypothetical protein n=1 Tax=Variovorax sp. LT1R20 TaxID=3443729 RepID=UPI003F465900